MSKNKRADLALPLVLRALHLLQAFAMGPEDATYAKNMLMIKGLLQNTQKILEGQKPDEWWHPGEVMKTPAPPGADVMKRAEAVVRPWLHGSEEHRKWLREIAEPNVASALQQYGDEREAAITFLTSAPDSTMAEINEAARAGAGECGVNVDVDGMFDQLVDRMAAKMREQCGKNTDAPWDDISLRSKKRWCGRARSVLRVIDPQAQR